MLTAPYHVLRALTFALVSTVALGSGSAGAPWRPVDVRAGGRDAAHAPADRLRDTLPAVTVNLDVIGDAPFAACARGLEIVPPYTEAVVEATSGPYAATPSSRHGCVEVDPSAAAAATGTVTAVLCERGDATACQRVVFAIRQRATCPDGPFALESEVLAPSDDPVVYCLADGADLANYEIRLDGAVTPRMAVAGCGGGTGGGGTVEVYAYSVLNVEDVDYRIDAWDVDGNSLIRKDTRGGIAGVADSMAAFDPDRDWSYDPDLGLVHTTELAGNYSPVLVLFDYRFGAGPTLNLVTAEVPDDAGPGGPDPDGAAVTLPGPGTYTLEVFNPTLECGDRMTVVVPPATQPAIDTVRIVAEAGRRNGPFCVPTDELPGRVATFAFCGGPREGTAREETPAGCFTYRADGFVGVDTLCAVACTDDPALCDTTLYLVDVRAEVPACGGLFAEEAVRAAVGQCDRPEAVCLPRLPGDAARYALAVDGLARDDAAVCGGGEVTVYDYGSLPGRGLDGPYRVEGFAVSGGTFTAEVADAAALADSLDAWDAAASWSLDVVDRELRGGAAGATYPALVVRQVATDVVTSLDPVAVAVDDRLALALMPGTHTVVATDTRTGCTDALEVVVECGCPPPLPAAFSRGVDCSTSEVAVCLPIPVDSLAGYTLLVDGGVYAGPTTPCAEEAEFVIDELELYGTPSGDPTAFSVDDFTVDGQTFSADVAGAAALADSLDRWDATASWRYDPAEQLIRGGNPGTVYSSLFVSAPAIPGSEPREIALEPTTVARGTLIRLPAGAGARALALDDGDGCVQEVDLTLVCVQTGTVRDTVDVVGTILYCVDESELTGRVDTLFDACPDAGGAVRFDFNAPLGCVTATGVTPGSSTACLVACDVNGVCDTTLLAVFVNPEVDAVDAVDDLVPVRVDETASQSLVANDVFGLLSSARIATPPARGTAALDATGLLTYVPPAGACGFVDSLRYEICAGQTCDEATAVLRVRCGPVEAYSGFTPNGDGVNDAFAIEGIDAFPEATVRVYNRWGNLVFESEGGYANDWTGTWDGGRLPAGTYFYLVEIPGEEALSGYVYLWR